MKNLEMRNVNTNEMIMCLNEVKTILTNHPIMSIEDFKTLTLEKYDEDEEMTCYSLYLESNEKHPGITLMFDMEKYNEEEYPFRNELKLTISDMRLLDYYMKLLNDNGMDISEVDGNDIYSYEV